MCANIILIKNGRKPGGPIINTCASPVTTEYDSDNDLIFLKHVFSTFFRLISSVRFCYYKNIFSYREIHQAD